jgi:hypothetical protein
MGAHATIQKFNPVIIAERFSTIDNQDFMRQIGYILSDISGMDAVYVPIKRSINKNDGHFVYQT